MRIADIPYLRIAASADANRSEYMNMKIKDILRKIAALLLLCLLISLLDHIFAPKYMYENVDGRITREFYDEKTQLDVIGLGSSTMYNAMSPCQLYRDFGITGYVRSNASQTLWQSYYLLVDALKEKRPSLVVLDVSFIKYGEEFIEEPSNRKIIESMKDPVAKWDAIQCSMHESEEPISYYLPILRYHSRWNELTIDDFVYAYSQPDMTFAGFIMDASIPDEQTIWEPEEIEDAAFPEKAERYLDKIIELCQRENIPLLLMKTPTFVNSWHKEYDRLLEEKAEINGLSYVNFDDYAKDMELDVRCDYIDDGSHLNISGAEKFNKVLGKYICDNYNIMPHENDKELKSVWDKRLEVYEAKRGALMESYEKTKKELGL